MKLISYNILDGGEGRADPLAEVIEAQKPDIVVLVEADHPEVIERIRRRLKMDVIIGQGKKHGAAILSHWPIVESINYGTLRAGLSGCLLAATIAGADGFQWKVAAVHLHPHAGEENEDVRMREVEIILEAMKDAGPHLLAGDFNANSPVQKIDPAKCKLSTREEWEKNGGNVPRRAVQKLLDAGYVDSLFVIDPDKAATAGSFSTQYPGQRVDYIFTHGIDPRRIKNATIEHDRLAKYASDHFPVTVEIE